MKRVVSASNAQVKLQVAREKLAAGARKFVSIFSFISS